MDSAELQNSSNFAYFSDPSYFQILEKHTLKQLQTFVKRNKGIFEEDSTTLKDFHPTKSQQAVLNFVNKYLSGPREEPLRFLLTGIGGMT